MDTQLGIEYFYSFIIRVPEVIEFQITGEVLGVTDNKIIEILNK